jgi:hypothetical protein
LDLGGRKWQQEAGEEHNERLLSLHASPNIISVIKSRKVRWAVHVARILVGKPEGKRPLERHRCRCEDNIRMDLNGNRVGMCGLDSSGLGWGSVAGCYENNNETLDLMKGGQFID